MKRILDCIANLPIKAEERLYAYANRAFYYGDFQVAWSDLSKYILAYLRALSDFGIPIDSYAILSYYRKVAEEAFEEGRASR